MRSWCSEQTYFRFHESTIYELFIKDYTIVDVTRAIDEEERTKVEMITDSFRLMIKVSKEYEITQGLSFIV